MGSGMTGDSFAAIDELAAAPAAEATPGDEPRLAPLPLRGRMLGDDLAAASDRLMRILSKFESRPGPVMLGPWLGEVGFEVLYWIPFMRWVHANFPGLRGRMIAVTRGGVRSWYHPIISDYVEIYDHTPPEEVFEKRIRDGIPDKQKKRKDVPLENEIMSFALQRLNLGRAEWFHPSFMHKYLRTLYNNRFIHWFRQVSVYEPLPQPELGPLEGRLPDDYIAVRFYESRAFPGTPENRALVISMLRAITEKTNVVLLNPGIQADDHSDFELPHPERVFRIDHLMTPSNNLNVQAAAISRARMFVGTYGGLSYLPPFLGVPSLCFYSGPNSFKRYHLELANDVFAGPQWAPFFAVDAGWGGSLAGMLAKVEASFGRPAVDQPVISADEAILT